MPELAARTVEIAPLGPVARRREVTQARHEPLLAEPPRVVERDGRVDVVAGEQMALHAPEDPLQARRGWRPFVPGIRVFGHVDGRA